MEVEKKKKKESWRARFWIPLHWFDTNLILLITVELLVLIIPLTCMNVKYRARPTILYLPQKGDHMGLRSAAA